MSRRYRSVFPGHPHHVIQRGNRRQRVFFSDEDRLFYLNELRLRCDHYGVKIWGYCLMDNHVHLVLVPLAWESMAKAIAETHCAYTRRINKRNGWRGYLWQGRFLSTILGEAYYWTVMRYVELNPVRAGIVAKAGEYLWSSARGHLGLRRDPVLDEAALLPHWETVLRGDLSSDDLMQIRLHCSNGKPLGDGPFYEMLEKLTGMTWVLKKRGPKAKVQ